MSNIEHKLHTMLSIQDELNQVVDPNWRDRGFRWEDAIVVEAVELFDHLPWKWWKKHTGSIDLEQAKLEAVDIWHFIMSDLMDCFDTDWVAKYLKGWVENHDENVNFAVTDHPNDIEYIKDAVRGFLTEATFINHAAATPTDYVGSFFILLAELGITFDELYTLYVAKTQLNRLRWANDYGGSYIKTWDGQEDNVWLAEYVKTLDVDAPDFKDQVYAGLVAKYEEVKKAASTGLSEE